MAKLKEKLDFFTFQVLKEGQKLIVSLKPLRHSLRTNFRTFDDICIPVLNLQSLESQAGFADFQKAYRIDFSSLDRPDLVVNNPP